MNKKKNASKIPFKDYIITIITATIIVFSVAFCFQLELLYRCEKIVNFEELSLKNLSEFFSIGQLEKLIEKNPENVIAHIKLANLYAKLNENTKANQYYQKALVLSQRADYILYCYAVFAAKNNMLNTATTLAEEIRANNAKTYEYRATIYEAIGDKLTQEKHFEGANKAYQVAHKYAKNIKNKKLAKKIQEKFALSYTKTADDHIIEGRVDDAIIDLKNSLKILQNPTARYKLALIYKESDPKTSERFMSKVLRENPYLVNPFIYNSLLNELYRIANIINNDGDINYYSMQLKKFKKIIAKAYLFKKDVTIDNPRIYCEKKFKSKEEKYFLKFDIKNNTDSNITDLFFDIQIISNSKTFEIEKQLITKINQLIHYDEPKTLDVEIDDEFKLHDIQKNNDIYAKFYCKKAKKAPWTLITIQKINI